MTLTKQISAESQVEVPQEWLAPGLRELGWDLTGNSVDASNGSKTLRGDAEFIHAELGCPLKVEEMENPLWLQSPLYVDPDIPCGRIR